jgi:DNA-binding CsgD family transcriptional regulator
MTAPLDLVAHGLETSGGGRASAIHLYGARGAGKTWALEQAGNAALQRGMRVLTAHGTTEDRELPFAALAALLAPVRGRLQDAAWSALQPVIRFDQRATDDFAVKVATFEFLCTLAAECPTVMLLDDVHLFDAASREVVTFAVRRADVDALCCISTDVDSAPLSPNGSVSRIDSLDADQLSRLLQARGVASTVAVQCAHAAQGNPGLALAISDGLSDEQRSGTVPVAVLPRPAGGLADELQRRLREHGESVCRALVVAAAEHGGEVAAVRSALAALGESGDGLADAEAAGLIEIVGTRIVFADPWTRAAAYHLVAPASRRAAHRALAGWFQQPNQAAQRAWHLAAGADGPNDAVADALGLLAVDTAHRGAPASAALTAERAAEFAESPSGRDDHLMGALGWWLDASSVDGVTRVVRQLDPTDPEGRAALAEAQVFLNGDSAVTLEPTDGPWGRRRARRLQLTDAELAGDHRAVLQLIDRRAVEQGRGDDLLSAAVAHRHAGRAREAREHLVRAQAVLDPRSAPGVAAAMLEADLDLLQGRADDALRTLTRLDGPAPSHREDQRRWLVGRASLVADPALAPSGAPGAFAAPGTGPLGEVRDLIRDGLLRGDVGVLREAVECADARSLPVEAGEARMWQATLADDRERRALLDLVGAVFHRCGVRGWDGRLAALAAERRSPVAVPRDAAIDALSQAELRVADAVARGLTNREVSATLLISVKTVDFHLQQIYRKIGVRSRTELAVRMAGHGTAATGERR